VRECLKLDPDHKKCSDFYKRLRKLTKHLENMRNSHDQGQFDECIKSAQQVVNHDANAPNFIQKGKSFICICNAKGKHSKVAIDACTDYLKDNANDAEALYYRGQAYIDDEQLEKAQADCHRSNEIENSQRAAECIDRINKLLKQRSKRDYYKILGVKRSADKNTIIKAYRKLAHKWHPDKYEANEKEQAQKMFIDIAAAKEVLTDPGNISKFLFLNN
jgi:DnaJ family protein C protein 3